ncbi:hypothetical protein [Nocardiopsis oceani]
MIAVVGSFNLDVVTAVPRHPVPGETVPGGEIAHHTGGKGRQPCGGRHAGDGDRPRAYRG